MSFEAHVGEIFNLRPICNRPSRYLALLLLAALIACSHTPARSGPERLAIIPFENLTNDPALDWVGPASAAVLAYDLTGPQNVQPLRAATIRDARLDYSTRRIEGYFTNRNGELQLRAVVEDPQTRRTVRTIAISASPANIAAPMNQLAKNLNSGARALGNCDTSALRAYGQAVGTGGDLQTAVQSDPHCIPLYLGQAESSLSRGDKETAATAAAAGLAQPNLDPIDRAELDYLAATAKNDSGARLQALDKLASLLPSDASLQQGLGELQLAGRDFQASVRSYERAARANPNDGALWNTLGYARAQLHDLAGAREALDRYRSISAPHDANALDSLGEVSFYCGDFAAAENYFLQANQKSESSAELLKAAEARMMTGNLAGADTLVARARGLTPLAAAEWQFLTGRRQKAIAQLQALPQSPPVVVQLALWNAQTGKGPVPQPSQAPLSRAVSMLLAGNFQAATPLLEQIYTATNPTNDGQVRTLLAWSYVRTNRPEAARKLLELYPIPLATSGNDEFLASLVFPKFVALRGEVLGSDKDRRLAAQYAGDLPDHIQ